MAIPGDPMAFPTLASSYPRRSPTSFHPLKVDLSSSIYRRFGSKGIKPKRHTMAHENDSIQSISLEDVESSANYERSPKSLSQDSFILSSMNMNFLERLILAWRIIFPPTSTPKLNSNAMIAKQRLKMILLSNRCAVNDEAKQKIVDNILSTLSDFVEIDSEDKVQFNVSTDLDFRTIYSVTVPVRRVKAEYQGSEEVEATTNTDLKDDGEGSASASLIFDSLIADGKVAGCAASKSSPEPRKKKQNVEVLFIEPAVNRTRNLLIWSSMRYHGATNPLMNACAKGEASSRSKDKYILEKMMENVVM